MKKSVEIPAAVPIAASGATSISQGQSKLAQTDVVATTAPSTMELKWKEFGTPGDAHRVLEARVGKWNVDVKMFEPGASAPKASRAKSEAKWIMDGRFVEETISGDWMGQKFSGLGTTGFDNIKKKYVASWIDNMGTSLMVSEGTYDAATKTFTSFGACPDVMTGKYSKSRSTQQQIDENYWLMQTFKTDANGKEYLAARMDYKRAGGSKTLGAE